MRFLVVGAGAIGGYFGGRLLEAGRDVTFLVRPGRAAQLAWTGLTITSKFGDFSVPAPPYVQADAIAGPFDVVFLSCKAYDLDDAMPAIAPAVGPGSAILPLLNGMRHLDALDEKFGADKVLGGECLISSTLDADGRVLHLNDLHTLIYGERDGSRSARVEAIASAFAGANFEARLSDAILQDMWEKWVFIATAAGITCLMRATVGDVVAAGGTDFAMALLDECAAIAGINGFAPRPAAMERSRRVFSAAGSPMAASMLRDMEHGGAIEADQIFGDLLGRAGNLPAPLLRIALVNAKTYEARCTRERA